MSWLLLGLGTVVGAGLATLATPLAGDLALAALGLVGLGGSAALAVSSGRLRGLPLEIADRVLCGEVDAVRVLRFRARLGLGRVFRDATARVWFVDDTGEHELPALVPAGVLVGPVTVLAHDPHRRTTGPGRLRVLLEVTAGGTRWSATRELTGSVQPGRFGSEWADPDPTQPATAC